MGTTVFVIPPLLFWLANMKNRVNEQMELGMRSQIRNNFRNVRQERLKRARWWFSRMRLVVDLALPPRPIGPARPEQTYLQIEQGNLL